jgi:hypothetical protein
VEAYGRSCRCELYWLFLGDFKCRWWTGTWRNHQSLPRLGFWTNLRAYYLRARNSTRQARLQRVAGVSSNHGLDLGSRRCSSARRQH